MRGRPPHDPQRQGLLGPGQLVQTADGRLVALGPGNTLVEVGTLVDPRRARQISQDREEMLYGPAVQQSQPQVYGRLPFGASRPPAAAELRGVAGTPPAARAVHADPRWAPQSFGQPYNTTQFSDQPFIEQTYSIEDQQYKQQQQEYREGQQHYYREDPRYQEDLYSDQYGMEVQAARLAGNLASPPWHGAARRRDDDLRNREDDIKAREDDIRSREDDLESDNTQHMGLESELDSEISSLFSYNDHPQRGVKNLHLVSPLEYAALLKQQYSDPPGLLGKDITPDSGVVVDSRNHSKERDARTRRDNFRTGGGSRNSRNCEQLGDQLDQLRTASSQLEQLGQLRTASSSGDEEESSSERESGMKGGRQYSQVPQSEPSQPEKKEVDRVRKSSEQSNVTDSDAGDQASYEYSADSLLSDSDKESPAGGSDPPVSEKLSTVCNEIKARFLND